MGVRGPARRHLIGALACAGSLLVISGCGGGAHSASATSSATSTTTSAASAGAPSADVAAWASQTQRLCVGKRAAIARLGSVNITYAGIARFGLPAVKRLLDGYLTRLLAVLGDFANRQQQIPTPPSLKVAMSQAAAIDAESQNVTRRVRAAVASSRTAAELSAGFNAWLATLKRLDVRGGAIAKQLGLAACRSGAGGTTS